MVWVRVWLQVLDLGDLGMKVILKTPLTCEAVVEAGVHKLKRERRESSERSVDECPPERKTVKIWSIDRPETEPVDEMYGRSKVARVTSRDGTTGFALQQALSDDDKH